MLRPGTSVAKIEVTFFFRKLIIVTFTATYATWDILDLTYGGDLEGK